MFDIACRCAPAVRETVRRVTTRRNSPAGRCFHGPLFVLVALFNLLAAPGVFAGSVSAAMNVSVTVVARAALTVASPPALVTITDADLARGYVDLPDAIIVEVRANSPAGYLLEASKTNSALGTIELGFGSGSSILTVGDKKSSIARPYIRGGDVITMHARVHLGMGTAAGSYPLSLQMSARPL